jgi:LmbE family N-acetylglucosaminyl deacetylase
MNQLMGLEAFDEVKRLIVIAAHPNDLVTTCGANRIAG